MSARTGRGRPVARWPVRVLMRRSEIDRGAWSYPCWEVVGVLPDADAPLQRCWRVTHETDTAVDLEWRGLAIALFRDAAESYWYNLVGREPSLFVICRSGEDVDLEPFSVTANYDEAGAHLEADDQVLSAPLPPAFGPALENFVIQHYRPELPRKRRRQDWKKEANRDDPSPDEPQH